jgi:hypothetical protein
MAGVNGIEGGCMKDVLDDLTLAVSMERAQIVEERLRTIIRPKPRWMPVFVWRRLLARLLYLESSLASNRDSESA